MGLADEGTLSLEMNFVPGDSGQQALLMDRSLQRRKQFKITFSDVNNATATLFAYVTGFTIGGGVDALTTATVTLEVTGALVWDFNPA
jgi:hypothetical protein